MIGRICHRCDHGCALMLLSLGLYLVLFILRCVHLEQYTYADNIPLRNR